MDLKKKTLLRRMFDFARSELERRAGLEGEESDAFSRAASQPQREWQPARAGDPLKRGSERPGAPHPVLDVGRAESGVLRVRWAVSDDDVLRSRELISPEAALCLRLVCFEGARDDVRREVIDRPHVATSGECELALEPARAVVAVGLRAGEKFVSIVHHVV